MTKAINIHIIIGFITVFLVYSLCSYAQQPKQNFEWQGETREYYTYIPASYDSENGMPVMVFLHGFDGGIDSYNSSINFQQAADQFHWMIVLPQALAAQYSMWGVNVPVGNTWNSGIEMTIMGSPFVPNSDVDDAGFLLALVDSLGNDYALNLDSLFFAGFSMGAFMTHRMAIEHSDRIRAVAAASGLIPVCYANSTPAQHISVLHIHGTDDSTVKPDGTASPIPLMGEMTLGLSVDATIDYWRNANQCGSEAETIAYPDTENDGMLFSQETYTNNTDNTKVALLTVDGGGHQWYEDGHDVQYLTVIHDFFTGHNSYIPTGIENESYLPDLTVFPNPAYKTITVESSNETQLFVYNSDGRIMGTIYLSKGANAIDISSYSAGLYLLRTLDGQQSSLIIR
ncbi:MAG: T9SS type A sorting domain-containing protein [Bacteroidales bacterium]|nr:T9SS type A sorting domain-containing protein [Bacteroidales bacterium]